MRKRIIISVIGASLGAFCVLFVSSMILCPDHTQKGMQEGALVGEYYADTDAGVEHEVIFVGDCEIYESFVPPLLFHEYGITSHLRGSPGQHIWHSYYLLKESFELDDPRVVVLGVYALRYGEEQNEVYSRLALDGMRMSRTKLCAIANTAQNGDEALSYLLPILRYHDNWKNVNSAYKSREKTLVSHNGYLMQASVRGQSDFSEGERLLNYDLPVSSLYWLDKIYELCQENGARLILFKAPTNSRKYWWYPEWDMQVREYATERGITYCNFLEDELLDVDMSQDTYDGGLHLNVYGAEKVTMRFGEILSEFYVPCGEYKADIWRQKYERYMCDKEERK